MIMISLTDMVKSSRKVGFLASLVAASMIPQGCQTTRLTETSYGNPIQRVEEVRGNGETSYYISKMNRLNQKIDVNVEKKFSRTDSRNEYSEVEEYENEYVVIRKPTSKSLVITSIVYPVGSVLMFGIPILGDVAHLSMGKPEKTVFAGLLEYKEEKKLEAKKNVGTRRKNETVKNVPYQMVEPAKNLGVKMNEGVKRTDSNGYVQFQDPVGAVVIETLAQDGKNDRLELK